MIQFRWQRAIRSLQKNLQHPKAMTFARRALFPAWALQSRTWSEPDHLRTSSGSTADKPNLRYRAPPVVLPTRTARDDMWYRTWAHYGILNLWAPVTDVHQFSLSQLWVWGGSGNGLQTVEAGWQRYPDKYGNSSAHLFSYYTPNNYTNGCYNTDCSAFVQTSASYFPGQTFSPTSVSGGTQYTMSVYYLRDGANGNWWLYVQGNAVGYYPSSLFNNAGIKIAAAGVDYGGEVSTLRSYTAMGGGGFASSGFGHAAYSRTLQYLPSSGGAWLEPSLAPYAPQPTCYDIAKGHTTSWGTYIYFGGPGVNFNCPL